MARVFNTPGVYKREVDVSEILVPTGVSNGGIVIRAPKGPINRPVLVTNDKEFIETFGEPVFTSGSGELNMKGQVPDFGYGSYSSLEFLKQSQALYVVRDFTPNEDKYAAVQIKSDRTESLSATTDGVSAINYTDVFDTRTQIASLDDKSEELTDPILVGFVGPGELGNNIAITVETLSFSADWLYNYDEYPQEVSASTSALWDDSGAVSGTAWTTRVESYFPVASKVFKINVYEKPDGKTWDNLFSNAEDLSATKLRFSPIETFYGTLDNQLDENKNQLRIDNVVNGISQYIYVKSNNTVKFDLIPISGSKPDGSDAAGDFVYFTNYFSELVGGDVVKSNGLTDVTGWGIFENREEVPAQILINPSWKQTVKLKVGEVVSKRKDAIAVCQSNDPITIDYRQILENEQYGYIAPSYLALYAGFGQIYDQYNDKNVWIPNASFAASIYARVDNIAEPWFAPAGVDRATLAVLDEKKIYTDAQIGQMYDKNINSVKWIRGTGYALWGQKTAQMKKSALDRVNVRRNLLYIENNIETALFPFVFENNNELTRLQIFSIVDEFLAGVQAGGGLTSYDVVCDDTNNTPAIIDSNQLNIDIYVQPVRTAEFISFTTVVTRTGISFSDVKLKYA